MNAHLWWYLSRATGVIAWAMLGLSVLAGISLATRALGRRPGGPYLLAVHRFCAVGGLVFTVGHLGALVADSYIDFDLGSLLLPMQSPYKPLAVTFGVVGLYVMSLVQLTSWAKKWLPRGLWRAVHLSSYLAFTAVTLHAFTTGTDRYNVALVLGAVSLSASIIFFTVYRLIGPGRAASVKPTSAKSDPAKSDPAKSDSAKSDSAKSDSAKLGSAKLGSAKLGSAKLGSVEPASARTDSGTGAALTQGEDRLFEA